jgi:hypothetical protein
LVIIIAGWFGIFSRKHYASLHFIEPWAAVAHDAARNIGTGDLVISNSPSFLFYLNAALYKAGLSSSRQSGWAKGPNINSLIDSDLPDELPAKQIMFVRGVNTSATQRTAQAEYW